MTFVSKGLTTVLALTRFIKELKSDLEGKNGVSSLLSALCPDGEVEISMQCPLATFVSKCVESFENLKFEEISGLVSDIAKYCPPMLDREQDSNYMIDAMLIDQKMNKLTKDFQTGRIDVDVQRTLAAVREQNAEAPIPVLLTHGLSMLRKDVAAALNSLNRLAISNTDLLSHGVGCSYCSFACQRQPSDDDVRVPQEAFHQVCNMSRKMASLHKRFNHFQVPFQLLSVRQCLSTTGKSFGSR